MSKPTIADALFSKTRQRVLSLLYGAPDQSFYTNEIVRRVAMGRGTVCRELENLSSAELLSVKRAGNQLHYQANLQNPVYAELAGLVRKTFGIADVLREALKSLDEQIELAFVYGSIAKETATAASDIDLLILSQSLSYAAIMTELTGVEEQLGRPINPSIYTSEQIQSRLKEGKAFMTRVLSQPKIWVKGADDELKRFG